MPYSERLQKNRLAKGNVIWTIALLLACTTSTGRAAEPLKYYGFDKASHATDLQGWGSTDPIFSVLFDKLRPKHVAEIGTWKGASALHMAYLANQYGLEDCEIVCIDTWLGSIEHWFFRDRPDYFPSLKLRQGYPTLYMTFLANVIEAGATERIVPFPVASTAAARFSPRTRSSSI